MPRSDETQQGVAADRTTAARAHPIVAVAAGAHYSRPARRRICWPPPRCSDRSGCAPTGRAGWARRTSTRQVAALLPPVLEGLRGRSGDTGVPAVRPPRSSSRHSQTHRQGSVAENDIDLVRVGTGGEGVEDEHLELIGKCVQADIRHRRPASTVSPRGTFGQRRQDCPHDGFPLAVSPRRKVPGPHPPEEVDGVRAWSVGHGDAAVSRCAGSPAAGGSPGTATPG